MTKLLIASVLAAAFIVVPVAFAENSQNGGKDIRDPRQELRQDIRDDRKDFRQDVKDIHKDIKDKRASEAATRKLNKQGHLIEAEITAINGSSFTVTKDGKTYIINTSSQTKFLRHFWGKSEINEFSLGNKINAWGKWTDENQKILDASMIRNLSVMKRHGVFLGKITSLGSGSFVIKSGNRGNQTVYYDGNTKFVDRKDQAITVSGLKVGDRVRVKGLWDKSSNKITETSQVKDFSLPEKAKITPTPTN